MERRSLWIYGHRGAAGEAPENTLASFARAAEQGADGVELDVQLTADGELAVVHDRTLERLAGDAREVEAATWTELASVSLREAPAPRRSGTAWRIPRLAEVLSALPTGFAINVEMKRHVASRPAFAERIAAALGARPGVVVSSFDGELLRDLRRRSAELALAPLAERGSRGLLELARELGAVAVHVGRLGVDRELVALAAAAGRPVLCYTVNTVGEAARLLALGVAGVFTDYPGWLRAELARGAAAPPG